MYSWEQRKLGEICGISKGEQLGKSLLSDNGRYYVLNGGIAPSGYTDKFNTEAHTISISEGGNSCGYVNYNATRFWSGGHNYTLKVADFINRYFLYQFLKFSETSIMALRVGSGLPNIQRSALEELPVLYPLQIEEQQTIGGYFLVLDNLITLHQRK